MRGGFESRFRPKRPTVQAPAISPRQRPPHTNAHTIGLARKTSHIISVSRLTPLLSGFVTLNDATLIIQNE